VDDGKLYLIKSTGNVRVPSHTFYADDLMVFCKGKSADISNLKDLFNRYANASGQLVPNQQSIQALYFLLTSTNFRFVNFQYRLYIFSFSNNDML
jgi:hypothetical protein